MLNVGIGIGIGFIVLFIVWWAYEMGKQAIIREVWGLTSEEFDTWRKMRSPRVKTGDDHS